MNNNNQLTIDIISTTDQQQLILEQQNINFNNNISLDNNNFQQRSNSVIVNPTPPNNLIIEKNKRKRKNENNQQDNINQLNNKKSLIISPKEVLGVNRFISPFSEEAKIPLPHELNELNTHGTTVWKRNERERHRVREVNKGYMFLKNSLPLTESDRRLSKVDTLRLAIAYIHHLEYLINQGKNHLNECQCFNYSMGGGDCTSSENTPPPQ